MDWIRQQRLRLRRKRCCARPSKPTRTSTTRSFSRPREKARHAERRGKNTREKPAGHKICICITAVAISLAVAACVWVFLPAGRQHSQWLAIEDTILLLIIIIVRSRYIYIQIPLLLPDPSLLSSSSNQPSLLNRLPRDNENKTSSSIGATNFADVLFRLANTTLAATAATAR